VSRRPYEQRLRAEAAEETRTRILDALYDLLRETRDGAIGVDQVARRARVARSTVYLAFGARSGLFDALTERLLSGAGHEIIADALRLPDARETLRGGLEGGVRMYAAHHDVLRVLNAMSTLDPEGVGLAIARLEGQRARAMTTLARRLDEQGLLRPGISREQAAHVIWLLAGFDAYDVLATGRRLGPDAVLDILVRTAEGALLS